MGKVIPYQTSSITISEEYNSVKSTSNTTFKTAGNNPKYPYRYLNNVLNRSICKNS